MRIGLAQHHIKADHAAIGLAVRLNNAIVAGRYGGRLRSRYRNRAARVEYHVLDAGESVAVDFVTGDHTVVALTRSSRALTPNTRAAHDLGNNRGGEHVGISQFLPIDVLAEILIAQVASFACPHKLIE